MALVTATEVRTAAKTYRTGILFQSDDDIDELIVICQEDLERQTNGIFDEREVIESEIGKNGRLIQLGHYPVKSIDELLINGSEYTLSADEYDLQSGSILLSTNPVSGYSSTEYSYQATYTTSPPSDANLAKNVLCRMVLDRIKNRQSSVEMDIKRLKRFLMGVI